jgi:DNA repair protein RadC
MNPLLTEVSTMTITSTPHSFFEKLQSLKGSRPRRSAGHPKASLELQYIVPERITDPATAAGAALALCRNRWEELTVVLYVDNQHRLVGHAVVATGWVQAALLTSRPILAGADACQASRCILVRYRTYGATSPSEAEDRSFRTIAAACSRYGLAVSDHLVVVATGEFDSVYLLRA